MTVKRVANDSESTPIPEGQTIGFVDTKDQLDAVIDAFNAASKLGSYIISFRGEEGIAQLKELRKTFNFGDGEDAFMEFALKELRGGRFAVGIGVDDREGALKVASVAEPLGAHSFTYFGTWANERLTR